MDKGYFFITTNGHTASKWLASKLASISGVFCSHGAANLNISTLHQREYSNDEKMQQMLQETRKHLPLDTILNEMESLEPNKILYGNVHMFNLRQFMENRNTYPSKRDIKVVDLVRNPVKFVESGYFNLLDQSRFNRKRVDYLFEIRNLNERVYNKYSKDFGLNLNDLATLSFMAICMTFKSFEINFKIHENNNISVFRMEDFTSKEEELERLINKLSPENFSLKESANLLIGDKISSNSHAPSKKASAEEIYMKWPSWKKNVFCDLLFETGCYNNFERLGYDLTFLQI